MLTDALKSFWSAGEDTGKIKNPYRATPQEGGAGADAAVFVRTLMKDALYVRYERTPGAPSKDPHGRQLAGMVIGTSRGEIDVQTELIRSGFSTFQSFRQGGVATQEMMAAQQDAALHRRGPMWGGAPPAPVEYRAISIDNALQVTGSFSPQAVTVVDADTFRVGLQAEIRLPNVNAPEITSKAAYGAGLFVNPGELKREQAVRWALSSPARKPRWYAIRKAVPSNPGQFEALKPHPGFDFPGGRSQPYDDAEFASITPPKGMAQGTHRWYVDIETQGLRTSSYTKAGGFAGRGPNAPIAVSQFAAIKFGGPKPEMMSAFTDLIDFDFLSRHGITADYLKSGRPLPAAAYDELRRKGYDPSVMQPGSVLDVGVRRHAQHVLEGKPIVKQADLYAQIANEWRAIADKGGKIEFHAWNVSYDLPEVLREMRRHGQGEIVDRLLATNSITAREMMEAVHQLQFDHMMRSNWTPVMTERSAIQAALGQNLKNITLADAKRLGMIREHTGLRHLMDDVRAGGRTALEQRAEKWLMSQGTSEAEARAVVRGLGEELGNVRDWNTFKAFTKRMHESRTAAPIYGSMTPYDVMGQIYEQRGQRHVHVLGSLSSGSADALTERLASTAMAGEYSGFSMILGNRLEDVGSHLIDNQTELRVAAERAEGLSKVMGHHEGAGDVRMAYETAEQLNQIQQDQRLSQVWGETQAAASEAVQARRVNMLYQDMLKSGGLRVSDTASAAAARGGGPTLTSRAVNKAQRGGANWATWALGAAAIWMLSENNRVDKTPIQIEGARRPDSIYNTISGILPSQLPFSNISAFHSGYDSFDVMATTMPSGPPASPPHVSQVDVVEGTRDYYRADYDLPAASMGRKTPPPLPDDTPISGMAPWCMSDARGAGFQAAHMFIQGPRVPAMRATDTENAEIALAAGGPSPAREYLLETFSAMGSGEDVDIGGETARIPLGYSGARAGRFRTTGHAGYVQRLAEDAMSSRIRDHATQLRRLPGMPVTTRGPEAVNTASHAEVSAFVGVGDA
jgi:hypothetical protein